MAIPEPLVTIRRYPSAEHSEEDHERLTGASITAYRESLSPHSLAVVIRVPESQVQQALAILPPAEPDLLEEPDKPKVCPWCGSDRARYPAPVARVASFVGGFFTALLAVYRQFEAAGLALAITLWAMYVAKIGSGLVCANCGREWRAPHEAPEPEHEPEREQGTEPEHEQRTEHPEG